VAIIHSQERARGRKRTKEEKSKRERELRQKVRGNSIE